MNQKKYSLMAAVLLVLLGLAELMAAVVLMAWMVVTVSLALLVHAVLRASPGRSVPLVRRAPPDHQVRPGSRAHRVPPDRRARREMWE